MGNGTSTRRQEVSPFQIDLQMQHTGSINCMTINETNTIMATGSDDCTIKLWQLSGETVEPLRSFQGHTKYVTCVVVHDKFIISASADCTIKRWQMSSGECTFTYRGHVGMINRIICTGDLILSSSYDCTVRAWLMDIGAKEEREPAESCVRIFKGHLRGVYPIAFIPRELEENLPIGDGVEINEDVLVTGSADGTARLWSIETASSLVTYSGHNGPVQCLLVAHTGRILYTGGADATVRMWRVATGEPITILKGHSDGIVTLMLASNLLFSASSDRTVRSWMAESGEYQKIYKGHGQSVSTLAFNEGILYTGSGDGIVRAYEGKTGILLRIFKGHLATINGVIAIGHRIYSCANDGTLRIWSGDEVKNSDNPYQYPKARANSTVADTLFEHPDDQVKRRVEISAR